ncbi:MAG TPA: xanthine dehydrogenase family protein subunit M [Anaerolineales bacterium]|nr:xanthine dehydrogenase family protein subunit M [Anaerolineales bacterium]
MSRNQEGGGVMQGFTFDSPQTLEEACQMLAETGGKLVAGGTDVIPQMRDGRFQTGRLIDLSRLDNLSYVEQHNGTIAIGALTNYTTLMHSPLLQTGASVLVEAAGLVGGIQTRNRGTVGGNIANASPAGDMHPPLLTLKAEVTLVSTDGERAIPLARLLQGPGETAVAPNEVIRQISFGGLPAAAKSTFLRLGNRRGMAVSVVSVAVVLQLGLENMVEDVRVALGAVAPTAIRCHKTESLLMRRQLTDSVIEEAANTAVQECSPIDDVRGSANYRRHGVKVLVRRGLQTLADRR